jgi:hypothetical protein
MGRNQNIELCSDIEFLYRHWDGTKSKYGDIEFLYRHWSIDNGIYSFYI